MKTEEELLEYLGWTKEQTELSKKLGVDICNRGLIGTLPYFAAIREISQHEELPVSLRCHLCITVNNVFAELKDNPEFMALLLLQNTLDRMKEMNKK